LSSEPQRLDAGFLEQVAATIGVGALRLVGETTRGESRSTYLVTSGSEDLIVKLVRGGTDALDNQRRLLRLVGALRERGYPAPEYLGVGRADGVVFTAQRLMPGQTLEPGPGDPPQARLFAGLLPELLAAIELQAGAGDLDRPPWPSWLITTIEVGGDGYCLHDTMRRSADTALVLERLQSIARRNVNASTRSDDVAHFDMNPANILHSGGRLSGIVDWNVPFFGAAQGDRGFDVATLLFYTYDVASTRDVLWRAALAISGMSWTAVYLCHLCLRQVEWSRRHKPASEEEARFMRIALAVLDECEARGA
jgi:aminoglycoside phosphotransferase (APT) family kinase protein